MKRIHLLSAGLVGVALTIAVAAAAPATPAPFGFTYEVTITNLTQGQIFAPVLVATHDDKVAMFRGGTPASDGLALLAEEGDGSMMFATLSASSHVKDVMSGTGPIMPGASETIVVDATIAKRYLSLAGMLVTTNDTFVGVDSAELKLLKDETMLAFAYDAGSEANSELCRFIPGPPCMSPGAHDPAPAEGFVSVSSGIHGNGDLKPAAWDWRGPVARVDVRRL